MTLLKNLAVVEWNSWMHQGLWEACHLEIRAGTISLSQGHRQGCLTGTRGVCWGLVKSKNWTWDIVQNIFIATCLWTHMWLPEHWSEVASPRCRNVAWGRSKLQTARSCTSWGGDVSRGDRMAYWSNLYNWYGIELQRLQKYGVWMPVFSFNFFLKVLICVVCQEICFALCNDCSSTSTNFINFGEYITNACK